MHLRTGFSGAPVRGAADYAREFWLAGFRVFGIHPFLQSAGGVARCACGSSDCRSPGKHPLVSAWQHTPRWSEDQFDIMVRTSQFASGFGILCTGLLVIDVDARNGGIESWAQLLQTVPEAAGSGLIVSTGSGGGSRHVYFRAPPGISLATRLTEYPGLDFKSSGFVIGPGSRHVSGRYSTLIGSPDDVDGAPAALIDLLRRPDAHRADFNGHAVDVSTADLADLLAHVKNSDLPYDDWLRVGMALHHATGGSPTGFQLWIDWSTTSKKHDPAAMPARWSSFGRSANPVTLGTLAHLATAGGWIRPVEFGPADFAEPEPSLPARTAGTDLSGIDLTCPPGFVGELAAWIEANNRRPRRNLAVAAALCAVANVAGLRYTDDRDGVTTNLFALCVAGSRTGKESVLQSITEIHRAAGIAPATHGSIKSEQEIVKNLTRHQAAFYLIDEIGILLQKIVNAQKRGGAVYLEGVIGALMSSYSKARGFLLITGDLRETLQVAIQKEIAQLYAKLDRCEGPRDALEARIAAAERSLSSLDNGIERPFLSLLGFTTPVTFDNLVTFETATNGFIGRALLFREPDTAPRSKPTWSPAPLPQRLALTLAGLYNGGNSGQSHRVENYEPLVKIPSEPAALDLLAQAGRWLENEAIVQKSKTGLEALWVGAYELVSKISLILAIPGGLRTAEHVRWAFALVQRDLESKSRYVVANEDEKTAPKNALEARLLGLLEGDGETFGVIANRLSRKFAQKDVAAALDELVKSGVALAVVIGAQHRQKPTTVFRLRRPSDGGYK